MNEQRAPQPPREIPPPFRDVRPELLILDVDGVLTNNTVYLNGAGEEWKPFFIPDGTGIGLLRTIGVEVCLVSGRKSAVVDRRAEELKITRFFSGVHEKLPVVNGLLDKTGCAPERTVYMGDDLIDLAPMARVGLPVAVANAIPLVRERACAVTTLPGGEGAVREVCEWIVTAHDAWDRVLERYTS